MYKYLFLAVLTVILATNAETTETVTILAHDFKPMCYLEGDRWTGFSIDLWEAISKDIQVGYTVRHVPHFPDILRYVAEEPNVLAPHGLTITNEREEKIDFSYPFFESGYSILIRTQKHSGIRGFLENIWILTKGIIPFIALFLIFCVVVSLLMWWAELGNDMFDDDIKKGWWDGFYWVTVVVTTVGFGDKVPKSTPGKLLTMVVMFTGIFMVLPMVIGKVSSEMTIQAVENSISGPDDLRSKKVAVKKGTTAVAYMKKHGAEIVPVENLREATLMLKAKEVDAVVHDYPALYAIASSEEGLSLTGNVFERQNYGIALSEGNPLRERINRSLLKLVEDGTYAQIKTKYFAKKSQ